MKIVKSFMLASAFIFTGALSASTGVVIENDRLLATFDQRGSTTFQYDCVGNLAQERSLDILGNVKAERRYEYSDASQLVAIRDSLEDKTEQLSLQYDELGRLTKYGDTTISYNEFNMMETFTHGDTQARYSYDSKTGLRNGKVVNSEVTWFELDEKGRVVKEKDVTGATKLSITYGEHGPETLTQDGKVYNYVLDRMGNVVGVMDEEGAIVNAYKYDVWGNLVASNETIKNPLGYRGEYRDEESGYQYLRGRYYNPEIRRFTTIDPAEDGLNWNAYCGNNPLDYTDPSGYAKVQKTQQTSISTVVTDCFYSDEDLLELYNTTTPGGVRARKILDWILDAAEVGLVALIENKATAAVVVGTIRTMLFSNDVREAKISELAKEAYKTYIDKKKDNKKEEKGLKLSLTITPNFDGGATSVFTYAFVNAQDVRNCEAGTKKIEEIRILGAELVV